MIKYKLFCTIDMKTYYIEAENERNAIKILAHKLNVPTSCIDVFR